MCFRIESRMFIESGVERFWVASCFFSADLIGVPIWSIPAWNSVRYPRLYFYISPFHYCNELFCCFSSCSPPSAPTCTPAQDASNCDLITSTTGPFQACIDVLGSTFVGQFRRDCIYDVVHACDDPCVLLGSFADLCFQNNVTVDWRTTAGCREFEPNFSLPDLILHDMGEYFSKIDSMLLASK